VNPVDIFRDAIGNAFRSKLRTALTVIAIFIGAFTLTLTSSIGNGVSSYIDTQLAAIGTRNILLVSKATDTSATDDGPKKYDPSSRTGGNGFGQNVVLMSPTDLDALRKLDGIVRVEPLTVVAVDYIEYGTGDKYQLTVNPGAPFAKADLTAGSQLDAATTQLQVQLPSAYVKPLGFSSATDAVGKNVTLAITDYAGTQHTVEAVVSGIQNATITGAGAGFNASLTSKLSELQATGRPSTLPVGYARVSAYLASDVSDAQIATTQQKLKDAGYVGLTVSDQIGSFKTAINLIVLILNGFAGIALVAAGFGIVNTLLMSVQERTREIGLMKAMGMGGGGIFALFSAEAVFIGFLGSAIGAGIAIAIGTVISNILAGGLLADLPGLQVMRFTPISTGAVILLVMFIAFLAGTLPARRASQQDPIEALRYE
jgi:putative ABC transport system permease protein